MEPRVRYIVVGLFALLTGLAGLGFILWIQNKGSLRGRNELIVRFEAAAPGLRTGAPVTFNGVRVGEVRRLAFDTTHLSAVDAHLAIDRDAPITAATQATLEAQGLLGAVYVSLAGGDASKPLDRAQGAPVIVARAATSLSQQARETLDAVKGLVDENAAPFHDIVLNAQSFAAALGRNSDRVDSILQGLDRTLGGGDKEAKPALYDLAAPAPGVDLSDLPEAGLVVADPTTVAALDTQRLIVKSAQGQLSPQAVQWPDTIPKIVQKRVLQSLDKAGYRFATGPGDTPTPDYQLALDIGAFEITESPRPMAEVTFAVRLLGADGKVIERSLIEGRAPAASTEPDQAVAAMNEAFAKAVEALLLWCRKALPGK
jgi:phospholipid/cholesterol/gamma-HCH transport system substrate-binding protein